MLVNPGDNVLLDAPTYSGTLAAVRAFFFCTTQTLWHGALRPPESLISCAASASRLQLDKRSQRSAWHDTCSPEGSPVPLASVRGPQARKHCSQNPLHYPKRRKPHRCLHDSREEEGSVWGKSSPKSHSKMNTCTRCRFDSLQPRSYKANQWSMDSPNYSLLWGWFPCRFTLSFFI